MEKQLETIAEALGCSIFHNMGNDMMCKAGAIRMGISIHRAKPCWCRGRRLCSCNNDNSNTWTTVTTCSAPRGARAVNVACAPTTATTSKAAYTPSSPSSAGAVPTRSPTTSCRRT